MHAVICGVCAIIWKASETQMHAHLSTHQNTRAHCGRCWRPQADVLITLQTLKDRILLPYAAKIQQWWLRKQERIMEHKLTRAMHMVTSSVDRATIHGVQVSARACAAAAAPAPLRRDRIFAACNAPAPSCLSLLCAIALHACVTKLCCAH
jgi:hypothetical protein